MLPLTLKENPMSVKETIGFIVTMVALIMLAVVFLAITGCAGKLIPLAPSNNVILLEDGNTLEVISSGVSVDMQFAVDMASSRARLLLSEYISSPTLYYSHVVEQDITVIDDVYHAVVKMHMPLAFNLSSKP